LLSARSVVKTDFYEIITIAKIEEIRQK